LFNRLSNRFLYPSHEKAVRRPVAFLCCIAVFVLIGDLPLLLPRVAGSQVDHETQQLEGEPQVPVASPVPEVPPQTSVIERSSSAKASPAKSSKAGVGNPAEKTPVWLNDLPTNILLGVVLVTLAIASLVGQYLRRRPTETVNPALVLRFRQRLNAWWLMCAILVFGLVLQPMGTVVLFGLVSFWALREFITMAPTRRGDHRALFWALIVFTPLQYVLIAIERLGWTWRSGATIDFYGLYSIMIPVYASLFVPARIALAGDHKRFLERTAQITVGLLICVYSLSYAPALINLQLARSNGTVWLGSPAGLLFFFVLMSQLSDILQWTWGKLVGRRFIAEEVSTSRTWEGFAGGTLTTGLIGATLFWVTPFTPWEAACMSMVVGVMGMFGGMTLSAIKRDRGVNDYGSLVLGHAGVLDRIDTVCFAAPVFYHLTRFFFTV
jgi:phosphatidate cytidylyltransferase